MLNFLLGIAVSTGIIFIIAILYAMYKLYKLVKFVNGLSEDFWRTSNEIHRSLNDKNKEIYDYIEHDFRENLMNELKK